MSWHLTPRQLQHFVDGALDENDAVRMAEHLDDCPECNARANQLDPMAAAFASVDDPVPPADLVANAIAAYEAPERAPAVELAVGGSLLTAAALLAVITGNPLGFLVDLGVFAKVTAGVGSALSVGIGSSAILTTVVLAVAFIGCLAALRLTEPVPLQNPLTHG